MPKSSRKCRHRRSPNNFLPTVAVLSIRGIGIRLLKRDHVGVGLLVARVNASRGRIKEPIDPVLVRRHQPMGVDKHREHTQRFVVLDESHAAHVGGEIIDVRDASRDPVAGFGELQIGDRVLRVR